VGTPSFQVEKAALDGAKAAADAGLPPGQASVLRLDFGNNGKVNSAVTKLLQKACPTGAFLVVSVDADNDAVCVFANAGKVAAVDAKAWCDAAMVPLGDGASSGGKAAAAMGSGPGAAAADAVVAAAKAFVA
jgi:alanyl-tRNA synthetase